MLTTWYVIFTKDEEIDFNKFSFMLTTWYVNTNNQRSSFSCWNSFILTTWYVNLDIDISVLDDIIVLY